MSEESVSDGCITKIVVEDDGRQYVFEFGPDTSRRLADMLRSGIDAHENYQCLNNEHGKAQAVADTIEEAAGPEVLTDGGEPTLKLTDDGVEIPDGVDLSDGVVFRARGATVDHKPGSPDRPFYPALDDRHLEEEQEHGVINENLDAFEVSIKPYGEEVETYHVQVPATDGGSEADSQATRWWGRPFDARRYHIFEGKGVARSLCENWQLRHDGKDPEVDPDEDSFTEGEDCKECAREAGVLDDE